MNEASALRLLAWQRFSKDLAAFRLLNRAADQIETKGGKP